MQCHLKFNQTEVHDKFFGITIGSIFIAERERRKEKRKWVYGNSLIGVHFANVIHGYTIACCCFGYSSKCIFNGVVLNAGPFGWNTALHIVPQPPPPRSARFTSTWWEHISAMMIPINDDFVGGGPCAIVPRHFAAPPHHHRHQQRRGARRPPNAPPHPYVCSRRLLQQLPPPPPRSSQLRLVREMETLLSLSGEALVEG